MKFIKILSKIVIAAGILLVVFAFYFASIDPAGYKENPANTFTGSDFSVSKTPAIATKTPTLSPTPTQKPLAKDALRYIINNGNAQKSFDKTVEKNQTVFSVLESLSKSDNLEMRYNNNFKFGVFIESIDNIKNGTDNKYWQFYINGALGQVAADKQEAKAGDIIEWRLENVPEF